MFEQKDQVELKQNDNCTKITLRVSPWPYKKTESEIDDVSEETLSETTTSSKLSDEDDNSIENSQKQEEQFVLLFDGRVKVSSGCFNVNLNRKVDELLEGFNLKNDFILGAAQHNKAKKISIIG